MDGDGMGSLGAFLSSDHSGAQALMDYIKKKDFDNWRMVKGLAAAKDIENKDMWIYIGKSKALTEDLDVFFKKCIKMFRERNAE